MGAKGVHKMLMKWTPCPSKISKKTLLIPEQRMASLFSSVGLRGGNTSAEAQGRASTLEFGKPEI